MMDHRPRKTPCFLIKQSPDVSVVMSSRHLNITSINAILPFKYFYEIRIKHYDIIISRNRSTISELLARLF